MAPELFEEIEEVESKPLEYNLRPYQLEAVAATHEAFKDNQSVLMVLATGLGKTVCFSHIAKDFIDKGRIMMLAHREELIFQGRDKMEAVTGTKADIEMGEEWAKVNWCKTPIVVSSIQTHNSGRDGGRMARFNPMDFNLVIVDEAHHVCAISYKKVLDYYKQNPNIKILGVTATPDRSDEEALGQTFSAVSYEYDIRDGIDDGWLVPIRQQCVTVDGLDYSSCRTTAGDLNNKDIAAILEFEEMLHGFADPTIELVGDRKCLVFTASVAHAERLTEIFNRHKDGSAEFITGKTPTEIRRNLLARYAKKDFQFLVNVGVATEGFDDPGIEVIVMARPTKSRCLYTQMAGRGTRPLPGLVDGMWSLDERKANIANSTKPYLEIIDFVGNSGRHKLVHAADVLGGKFSDEVVDLATKNVLEKKDKQAVDMLTELRQVEAELHRRRKLAEEAAIRAKLLVKAKFSAAKVNPFDVLDIEPVRERSWHKGRQPSIKQCEMIKRNGLDPDGLSFTHAQQIIKEIIARDIPTLKQAKILRQFGYAENIRKSEASKIITAIVANGWKRPI